MRISVAELERRLTLIAEELERVMRAKAGRRERQTPSVQNLQDERAEQWGGA